MSVYRTIGPLVFESCKSIESFKKSDMALADCHEGTSSIFVI